MRYWKQRSVASLVTISSCNSTLACRVQCCSPPEASEVCTTGNQAEMSPASLITDHTSSAAGRW